jgi:hypothetical protein
MSSLEAAMEKVLEKIMPHYIKDEWLAPCTQI